MKQLKFSHSRLRPAYWLPLLGLIGFGLRLHQLTLQPLWGDEGWSFYIAVQPVPRLLAVTAGDIHPPLYYLLLKGWLFLVGIGPEEARFLSVIVGTLLIPVMGLLGWRVFGPRVGVAAAATTTVMPMAIYYSQEVRMYGLVTLLGAMSAYFFLRQDSLKNNGPFRLDRWGLGYVVSTVAALYTMYYAVFILFFQSLYVVLISLQVRGRARLRLILAALAPLGYVLLLYLPWLVYAGQRLPTYIQNKRAVEGYFPLNIFRFLGAHFVAFSLGHLPDSLLHYTWAALPFVLAASIGFIAVLYTGRRQPLYLYLYLFIPLLSGYLINLFFPFTPPYFERTLLLAAPAYWLFIAVGLAWLWTRHYLWVGAISALLLLILTVSLFGFYTTPRYPHADYRPLLRDVAARATEEDTLLASYQWQLGFYHAYLPVPRPKFYPVPGWGEGWAGAARQKRMEKDLAGILARSPRLWFPAYQKAGHLWEDEAEAVIARLGYPALLQWYNPETKLTLAGSARGALAQAPLANYEDKLSLVKVGVGPGPFESGRGIVPVYLTWLKEKSLGSEHRVNLRLVDNQGRTWASRDSYPQSGQAFFTDLDQGDILEDRHGLLVAAGTPPGRYRLLLSVRQVSDAHPLDLLDANGQPLGAELRLADVEVIDPDPPVGAAALPVQAAIGADFGQAVRLVGYNLGSGPFKAGERLPLNLFWETLSGGLPSLLVSLQLQDENEQPLVAYQAEPVRSTQAWQPGFILRDPHDIPLPPTLPPGRYNLVLSLATPEQARLEVKGQEQLLLTEITTVDRPRTFEPPAVELDLAVNFNDQARLVGLDLPQQSVKAGQGLPLTLYWQALSTFDRNWTVFVHLIDQKGRIVGQQDQIPGAGQFPTTGWLPDEYLTDAYHLQIPADTPAGEDAYLLEVGLYDANDFTRLPILERGEIAGDHVVLKQWPISVE